jgi:hypothetical protein
MATEIQKNGTRSFVRQVGKKVFLEDWGLKLTALVITLGLWFAVTGLSTPTRERKTVPLEFIVSPNAQITSSTQQDVQIDLSGDKRKLDQIDRDQLKVISDLSNSAPGDLAVTLSPETVSVDLPQGVKLEDVQPGRIRVKLEAVAERDLEVKPQTIGDVVAGYEVYSISVVRPRIRVRGPASVVNTLDNVFTEKIDLAGRREDFTARQVPVGTGNPQASVLDTFVDVFFRIGERRIERYFSVPVPSAPGRHASFFVYGPRSVVMKAKPEDFRVDMQLSGNGDLSPQVTPPIEIADLVEIRRLKMN